MPFGFNRRAATGNGSVGNPSPTTFSTISSANTLALGSYTASVGGTVQYLHFRVQYLDSSSVKRFGVWNSAGTLLAEFLSAAYALDASGLNWYVVALASPLTLTAGQTYILGLATSDASWRMYRDSGTLTTRADFSPSSAFSSIDPAGISTAAAFVLDNNPNADPN